MFDYLSQEHAKGRCTPQDLFLYDLELQVKRCPEHVENCWDRFRDRWWLFRKKTVVTRHVFLTSTELDIMRRSGGAGLYSGAPQNTCDSNTHFATYRLDKKDRKGDPISIAALDHLFGYLTAAIQAGREVDSRCAWCICPCLNSYGIGMKSLCPLKLEPTAAEAAAKAAPGPLEELPEPLVDIHMTTSQVAGCDLCHDKNERPDTPPLAVRFLPQIEERIFWLNSQRNVEAAILGRIVEPHEPFTLDADERADLTHVVDALRAEIKSDVKQIDKIIQSKLGINGWKSAKWNETRATRELNNLRNTYAPRYKFSAAIKLEPSKNGKPPRLLIADGDKGQVMAWVMMATLEKWIFKRYQHRSIKALPKKEAMQRVVKMLGQTDPRDPDTPVPVAVLENDGSAWDACMSELLRELTENPIMDDFSELIEKYFMTEAPQDFLDARKTSNRLKTLGLELRKDKGGTTPADSCDLPRGKCWRTVIRAIRRSGCRGTSVLNFLSNMVCWCWVLGGRNAAALIRPNGAKVVCVDGVARFVKMCFEGDDSILTLWANGGAPSMSAEFKEMLGKRWTSLGHRPKLHWRRPGEVAEFTGWHFSVDYLGLDPTCMAPDLIRSLTAMAYSTNPAAVAAAASGDRKAMMEAVAPGMLAKVYPWALYYPVLARQIYAIFAPHLKAETEYSRDELYSLDLQPEDFGFSEADVQNDPDERIERATYRCRPILERFELQLAEAGTTDPLGHREPDIAVKLGVVPDDDAYHELVDLIEGGFKVGADNVLFQTEIHRIRGTVQAAAAA